jgi:hypothetical protein
MVSSASKADGCRRRDLRLLGDFNVFNADLTQHNATEEELADFRSSPDLWTVLEKVRQTIREKAFLP